MRPFHYISGLFFLLFSAIVIGIFKFELSAWWLLAASVVYIHLLVLGAIYIRWNFYLKSFSQGVDKYLIALTFDDGPAGESDAILDILKEKKVSAAFFSIGRNADAHPSIVERWHMEGHVIGNHSYNHGFNFDWKSTTAMVEELDQTNETISKITGKKPLLFRPPYGVTNPNVAGAVKRTGMHSIAWNVRSFDTTAKDPQQLLSRILDQLKGGDIILLHDSMAITRQILTELIDKAQQKGFTFVRVDKMLGLDAYA